MPQMTIRARLYCLVGLTLALMMVLGISSHNGLLAVESGLKQVLLTNSTLRNHIEGDMMHDALRADVLSALLAKSESDWSAATRDVTEHARKFRELIAAK